MLNSDALKVFLGPNGVRSVESDLVFDVDVSRCFIAKDHAATEPVSFWLSTGSVEKTTTDVRLQLICKDTGSWSGVIDLEGPVDSLVLDCDGDSVRCASLFPTLA